MLNSASDRQVRSGGWPKAPAGSTSRFATICKGSNGRRLEYAFQVPEDYDPDKKYLVAFYLHGGVSRAEPWRKGDPWWKVFDRPFGSEQISVFPSSYRGALWWQSSQIENLKAILNRIAREYNVDENRVALAGVSDGGMNRLSVTSATSASAGIIAGRSTI